MDRSKVVLFKFSFFENDLFVISGKYFSVPPGRAKKEGQAQPSSSSDNTSSIDVDKHILQLSKALSKNFRSQSAIPLACISLITKLLARNCTSSEDAILTKLNLVFRNPRQY
jgi:hypothetical protein